MPFMNNSLSSILSVRALRNSCLMREASVTLRVIASK